MQPLATSRFACLRRYAALLPIIASAGCVAPQPQPLPPDQAVEFRARALNFLKKAATGDDPVLRMQAIEAFQEAAPLAGIPFIEYNLDSPVPAVSFAALMAIGTLRDGMFLERVRTHTEHHDPNVRIAAIFALHRLGDESRTSELSSFLLSHPKAGVRANAAMAIGRLGEPGSVRLLRRALHQEQKNVAKMQILEALAMLGDEAGIERLRFYGYSAVPDQSTLAVMFLANAACHDAEALFRYRLTNAEIPETRLQAARGLGKLDNAEGLELAVRYLFFNSPDTSRPHDPPEVQIERIRGLAALALGAIGRSDALGPLRRAYNQQNQSDYVRLAIARAVIEILPSRPSSDAPRLDPPPRSDDPALIHQPQSPDSSSAGNRR